MTKYTRFRKLKRAIEALDPNIIGKKLGTLEQHLQHRGLELEPKNTAFTQDGIYYIDPESGIATKVIIYVSDFTTNLTKKQRKRLPKNGYTDHPSIKNFDQYHIMRCNTLTVSERDGWVEPYRICKRVGGDFYYRIIGDDSDEFVEPTVYQEIEHQKLYVCQYCLWKAGSLIIGAQGATQESFRLEKFFDVNLMQSWNSHGFLSKDVGFTEEMYPEDWQQICQVRMRQVSYQCERCFEDLSIHQLRRFLYINPTDHVMGREGYVKLDCLCIACFAENCQLQHADEHPVYKQYIRAREQLGLSRPRGADDYGGDRPSAP